MSIQHNKTLPCLSPTWPVPVRVAKSPIQGKGVFAQSRIKVRQKIGEFEGELIDLAEGRRRAKQQTRIAIVEFEHGKAIDGTRGGNDFRYINHSCSPNIFMRRFRNRVEFYALEAIRPGEELTCDYGESHHEGTHRCRCGSRRCQGFL